MSPIRRRVLRRRARRIGRRTTRRAARRTGRRMRRRTRRLIVGGGMLLLVGGTTAALKLALRDIRRIELHTGGPADDLTQGELLAAMKRLGIQKLELTADDEAAIERADAEEAN
jgi:hypothetical protein